MLACHVNPPGSIPIIGTMCEANSPPPDMLVKYFFQFALDTHQLPMGMTRNELAQLYQKTLVCERDVTLDSAHLKNMFQQLSY